MSMYMYMHINIFAQGEGGPTHFPPEGSGIQSPPPPLI